MSRREKFEPVSEVDPVVEDADDRFLRYWIRAGFWAQNATLLGLMVSACALLFYHL